MAALVSTCADVISRIIEKVREIKALPDDCQNLAYIVSKLQPIYLSLEHQLQESEHRTIIKVL